VRPVLTRVTTMPVANEAFFDASRRFYDRLDGVRELLTDGRRTSVRLVFLRVGAYRRAIVLPDSLRRRPVDRARMAGDHLEFTFGTVTDTSDGSPAVPAASARRP
jgi:hypothetical protein